MQLLPYPDACNLNDILICISGIYVWGEPSKRPLVDWVLIPETLAKDAGPCLQACCGNCPHRGVSPKVPPNNRLCSASCGTF